MEFNESWIIEARKRLQMTLAEFSEDMIGYSVANKLEFRFDRQLPHNRSLTIVDETDRFKKTVAVEYADSTLELNLDSMEETRLFFGVGAWYFLEQTGRYPCYIFGKNFFEGKASDLLQSFKTILPTAVDYSSSLTREYVMKHGEFHSRAK